MTTGASVWLGKLTASIGSSPTLIGVAIGGLVIGTVGSLTLGGRAATLDGPGEPLPLFACPDGQTVVGQVGPGEQVLVTARTADGAWLEVHFPDGLQQRAWAERAAFTLDADPGGLPVGDCVAASGGPRSPGASLTITANYSPSPSPTRRPVPATAAPTEAPTAAPSPTPSPTPTIRPTASPKATPTKGPAATPTKGPTPTPSPTPTPAPTPTNDTTPPSLSGLTANPTTISFAPDCVGTTTISVNTDPSGVQSITLWYDPPGAALGWTSKPMVFWVGNQTSAIWRASVTSVFPGWDAGTPLQPAPMYYYVIALDSAGNSRQLPLSNYPSVGVIACQL